jgi:hypothetical protein
LYGIVFTNEVSNDEETENDENKEGEPIERLILNYA